MLLRLLISYFHIKLGEVNRTLHEERDGYFVGTVDVLGPARVVACVRALHVREPQRSVLKRLDPLRQFQSFTAKIRL